MSIGPIDDEKNGTIKPVLTPTDGSFTSQWHLRNTGQNGGVAGVDIDVMRVWDEYRGSGIKVAVIDDGFDLTHPDLAANFNTALDFDYRRNDAVPFYESGDAHGTAVSGVIAADNNGIGSVGVAPDATLIGLRVSFENDSTMAMFVQAMQNARNFDIVNNSWNFTSKFYDNFNDPVMANMRDAVAAAAQLGRGGLGTNIVFAAGNSALSGDNVNYHNMDNSSYTIAVGAIDNAGRIASFSTPGAAVLVSAPGVNIYTTDNSGNNGYVAGNYVTASGTSFSAPMVSGVIALMLDANENLGYRDVQEILAYSATNIGLTQTGWIRNGATTWNGGGLHYSSSYGFGLVDAHTAVRLAETWGTGHGTYATLDIVNGSSSTSAAIPDGVSFVDNTITLAQDVLIDRVEVTMNIVHSAASQLTATLISPDGTQSILVARPSGIGTLPSFTFDSVAFWGEESAGNWTLRVSDAVTGTTGSLNSWSIKVLGDSVSTDDAYILTDEFRFFNGSVVTIIDPDGGHNILNASAMSTDIYLDLAVRTGMIMGREIIPGTTATFGEVYMGDGNDDYYSTSNVEIVHGGRGNDSFWARGGDDILYGDAGNDSLAGVYGNDTIYGGTGNDRVFGGADNDWLYGDAGNDLVSGDMGNDNLYGGAGQDTFLLTANDDFVDVIHDFQTSGADADRMDLSNLIDIPTVAGNAIANFVSLSTINGTDTMVRVNADGQGADFTDTVLISGATFTDTLRHYLDTGVLIVNDHA